MHLTVPRINSAGKCATVPALDAFKFTISRYYPHATFRPQGRIPIMTEQDSQDVVGRASNTPHSRSQRSSRSSSLTPATTVHSRSSATKHKAFRRTYVACKSCRTRKVKCIIDNKPPCEKCAREHRECQFNTHKTGKKQRQPPLWTRSASRDPDTAIASCISPEDDASITRHHDALSQHSNTSNIPPSPVRNINTAYTTRSSQVSLTVPGP